MKTIKIKYNPFLKSTEIIVDGQIPACNSSLHFGEKRLQEWAGELPKILVSELHDCNFSIEFTGTLADFEDLKLGLFMPNSGISIDNLVHYSTPSVAETEAEVDRIFEEITNGPVEELKDSTILAAFQKAKDLRFEINVVATMSSGKSSLINALLATELMPVENQATTATIVNIIDTDRDGYSGVAYDSDGNQIANEEDLNYSIMECWNKNEKISSIDIEGRIPCVNSVGMRLVLIDTPGPNNSADESHRALTYNMLNNSDKSLVLFVMRADNSGVDDEKAFLEYVCDCMNKGGKQSRDRYIFAINKMDLFNPIKEDTIGFLERQKLRLEEKGIFQPNIFPVSALAAIEARTTPEIEMLLPTYRTLVKKFPSTHFDSYYQFSHLPNIARAEIEQYLEEAENNPNQSEGEYTKLEIHSGIVSIEKAIELYINKYARTIKVYDLVQSFNNRLNELAAIATLEQSIRDNTAKKEQLNDSINRIKQQIDSGESAQQLSNIVMKIDRTKDVTDDLKEYCTPLNNKIAELLAKSKEKVLRSEAEKQAKEIEQEYKDIQERVEAKIQGIMESNFGKLYKNLLNEYEQYINELGLNTNGDVLNFKLFDFVAEEIVNIEELLIHSNMTIDEGHFEDKTVTKTYYKERSKWNPARWFGSKYKKCNRTETIQEWIPKNVQYINMREVMHKYLLPIQEFLNRINNLVHEHVKNETENIKENIRKQLTKVNEILKRKLDELSNMMNQVNATELELENKQNQLEWMNRIISRVNELINF